MQNKRNVILKLTYAAMCLALTVALPQLIGRIPEVGKLLSPMHLPVFLAGLLVGPIYAAVIGAVAPMLNFLLFGTPMIVSAIGMIFELAAYGSMTGIFYRTLPKKTIFIYISLLLAMLIGRIVGGISKLFLLAFGAIESYGIAAFFTGYFVNSVPAILSQMILIPLIYLALKRSKLTIS